MNIGAQVTYKASISGGATVPTATLLVWLGLEGTWSITMYEYGSYALKDPGDPASHFYPVGEVGETRRQASSARREAGSTGRSCMLAPATSASRRGGVWIMSLDGENGLRPLPKMRPQRVAGLAALAGLLTAAALLPFAFRGELSVERPHTGVIACWTHAPTKLSVYYYDFGNWLWLHSSPPGPGPVPAENGPHHGCCRALSGSARSLGSHHQARSSG